MESLFRGILELHDVQGVLFISLKGKLVFKKVPPRAEKNLASFEWRLLAKTFQHIMEAELVYTNNRLYYRETDLGYLFVIMGWDATIGMVRLKCHELLSEM